MTNKLLRIYFLTLSFFYLPACSNNSESRIEKKFFSDIDLFKMKGIDEVDSTSATPYIKIEYVNDSTWIIGFITNKNIDETKYVKTKGIWGSSYLMNCDSNCTVAYEFIIVDKVIRLEYNELETALIGSTVFHDNTVTTYEMPKDFYVNPIPESLEKIQLSWKNKTEKKFILNGDIIRVSTQEIGDKHEIIYRDRKCYKNNNRSIFWWYYFYWTVNKISCDSTDSTYYD